MHSVRSRHAAAWVAFLLGGLTWSTGGFATPQTELTAAQGALPTYSAHASLGLGAIQTRDDLLRPLVWTGATSRLSLGGARTAADNRQRIAIYGGVDPVVNRFGHLGAIIEYGGLLSTLHRVVTRSEVELLLGVTYRFDTVAGYYAQWDNSFLYWLTSHTFAPTWALAFRPLSDWDALVSVELPLLGLVSRPPTERLYKVDPLTYPSRWPGMTHADPSLSHPGNFFAPELGAVLTHRSDSNWAISVCASVSYRYAPEPRAIRYLREALAIEVKRDF